MRADLLSRCSVAGRLLHILSGCGAALLLGLPALPHLQGFAQLGSRGGALAPAPAPAPAVAPAPAPAALMSLHGPASSAATEGGAAALDTFLASAAQQLGASTSAPAQGPAVLANSAPVMAPPTIPQPQQALAAAAAAAQASATLGRSVGRRMLFDPLALQGVSGGSSGSGGSEQPRQQDRLDVSQQPAAELGSALGRLTLQRVLTQATYSCLIDLISPMRKLMEKLWPEHPAWAPYVCAFFEGVLIYVLQAQLPARIMPARTSLLVPDAFAALVAAQAASAVGKLQEGMLALEAPPLLALLLPIAASCLTAAVMWPLAAAYGVAAVSAGQLVFGFLAAAGKITATLGDSLKPAKEVVARHKLQVGAAAACLLLTTLSFSSAACPACCAWRSAHAEHCVLAC